MAANFKGTTSATQLPITNCIINRSVFLILVSAVRLALELASELISGAIFCMLRYWSHQHHIYNGEKIDLNDASRDGIEDGCHDCNDRNRFTC